MYVFECVCGEFVRTPKPTGTCPHCARPFDLRWGEVTVVAEPRKPSLPVRVRAAKAGAVP